MIKLLSLFSGIGAFEKALTNLGIPFELVNFCEFDKYASQAYALIHHEDPKKNLGDITKVDVEQLPDEVDMVTYGFPCQDISLCGNMKGLFDNEGKKTRSGLFFDALDVITHTHPQVAVAENVKNLTSNRFREQFGIVLKSLEEAGYNNYWKVMNSKDYGIPQNRERVFIVSIRKDVDTGVFEFPAPLPLKKSLKQMLERNVGEQYWMRDDLLRPLLIDQCPTYVVVRTNNSKGYDIAEEEEDSINFEQPSSKTRRGRVGHGVSQTLTTSCNQGVLQDLKVRKFTPKECFRLQGFDDEDCDVCVRHGISNTQLYKMAGNSITVDVLEELFCMIFDEEGKLFL